MNKLNELKTLIHSHLNNCDAILHPEICKMKATPEGFAQLEKEILERCVDSGKTVGQVMNEIEKEYNPNLADD